LSFQTFIAVVDKIMALFSVSTPMWRVWGRAEGCTGFWWGNLRERDHCGDQDADGRIILRLIFSK